VTEPSRAFAVGVAQALAKLHKIPLVKAAKLPGAMQSTRERVEQEISFYEETWRASGETSIAMEQGLAWLKSHMNYAEGQRAIIHRDVGCHNMLGKDGDLSALLDWETAAVGNPAHDLMYAYVCVVQMMPWEDFLAEYEKSGGTIPGKAELDFYRILVALFGIHFTILSRSFISTSYTDTMVVAYAAERIHLQYERALHDAVRIAFERDE
jgi:aminoglycoside phosphotransferase (APT) family kinase protein